VTSFELIPAPSDRDLPCLACDRMGRSWAYRAEIIVRPVGTRGLPDEWMCWGCFGEWREIPEYPGAQYIRKPPAPVRFSFYTPHDEMRSC